MPYTSHMNKKIDQIDEKIGHLIEQELCACFSLEEHNQLIILLSHLEEVWKESLFLFINSSLMYNTHVKEEAFYVHEV